MATTTTHYGFDIPQSTDLVKDGATAIATLGQDIDTAMNTALGTKKSGLVLLNTTSFSGVASFDFPTDVFTSTYDRYLIHMYAASSSGARALWRGRTTGSANTTANYHYQQMTFNNTSVTGGRTAGDTKAKFAYVDGANPSGSSLYIYQPKNATKTYFRSIGVSTLSDGYVEDYAGAFALTTSFDSIQILIESGTFTGKASLYGFNE